MVDVVRTTKPRRQQATITRAGRTKCYYGARHSTVERPKAAGWGIHRYTCRSSTMRRIHVRNASSLIPFRVVISSTSVENFSVLQRPSEMNPNRTEPGSLRRSRRSKDTAATGGSSRRYRVVDYDISGRPPLKRSCEVDVPQSVRLFALTVDVGGQSRCQIQHIKVKAVEMHYSALEVLRNRALQIDIYLLTYLLTVILHTSCCQNFRKWCSD